MMPNKLSAATVYLRLVAESDAAFICKLRGNAALNAFLSPSDNDTEVQRKWIAGYKTREQEGREFYFIICRKDNDLPIGTVRMYDFREQPKSFCWGSWILNDQKTPSAALESALLVYRFAFSVLQFEQSHFDVRKGNEKVHAFHLKTGARKTGENGLDVFYIFPKEQFDRLHSRYAKLLHAETDTGTTA